MEWKFYKKQGVHQVFFLSIFSSIFLMGSLLFDDLVWLRETEND